MPVMGNWIVETTNSINEMVTSIQPQPDLGRTVVVTHPEWLLQHHSPLLGFGLRADMKTLKSQARSEGPVALLSHVRLIRRSSALLAWVLAYRVRRHRSILEHHLENPCKYKALRLPA